MSWPTLLALLGVLALAVPITCAPTPEGKNRLAAEREATIQSDDELVGLLQGT